MFLDPLVPLNPAPHAEPSAAYKTFRSYQRELNGDVPLVGYLVQYRTPRQRFTGVEYDLLSLEVHDVGLNILYSPDPVPRDEAFKKLTLEGHADESYLLEQLPGGRGSGDDRDEPRTKVTLMVRGVTDTDAGLVRHLVREAQDLRTGDLTYTTLARLVLRRDPEDPAWFTEMEIHLDEAAMARLSSSEQTVVHAVKGRLWQQFAKMRDRYDPDHVQSLVHTYLEKMGTEVPRPGSGVFFVRAEMRNHLNALLHLVPKIGGGSDTLLCVSLPVGVKGQEAIAATALAQARRGLEELAADIDAARRNGAAETQVKELLQRLRDLQRTAAERRQQVIDALTDADAALGLAKQQIARLMSADW